MHGKNVVVLLLQCPNFKEYLNSTKSPTAKYIQKIGEFLATQNIAVLGVERHHFCRQLLPVDLQKIYTEDIKEEVETNLEVLLQITLEIAKKANVNVMIFI
jgi:hypothetical protein